ncbi:uncharacterized protein LOC119636778 isoform X1 [Glossina fuscipes]|uniref:Uncharacterized protein LOC119636778 isoform X1 n=1 Tax=Glossina fuscipes TaxID=7396 RepID=A0A9C5YYK2_9MUSC|nr:uncharacterized protein LOC119636778 isoform X1 [Glossina fuscipes]XP_037888311.1 uncharacterized protein LOC119636778 isoform X1 [Glossina fuscipes]
MRPTFDCRFYILLFIILIQCIFPIQPQNIRTLQQRHQLGQPYEQPADQITKWSLKKTLSNHYSYRGLYEPSIENHENMLNARDDAKPERYLSIYHSELMLQQKQQQQQQKQQQPVSQHHYELYQNSSIDNVNNKKIVRNIEESKCAKNCLHPQGSHKNGLSATYYLTTMSSPITTAKAITSPIRRNNFLAKTKTNQTVLSIEFLKNPYNSSSTSSSLSISQLRQPSKQSSSKNVYHNSNSKSNNNNNNLYKPSQMPSMKNERYVQSAYKTHLNNNKNNHYNNDKSYNLNRNRKIPANMKKREHQRVHIAHRMQHKEVKTHRETTNRRNHHEQQQLPWPASRNKRDKESFKKRNRRETEESDLSFNSSESNHETTSLRSAIISSTTATTNLAPTTTEHMSMSTYHNESLNYHHLIPLIAIKSKRGRSLVRVPAEVLKKPKESVVIIDDGEEFDSGAQRQREFAALVSMGGEDKSEDYSHDDEPRALPLRPILPNPYEDEEMSVVYAEQHSEIRLMCEVDLDIASTMWYKNGQVVHAMDRTTRVTDYRFIKEANGALTITNVMLEDDGKWQCEAENTRQYTLNARPVKLVVLDRPKPPYLLIDSRRLDAGNIFVPVKENSELNLACVSEGGNPKPTLTWEVLLSPGVDRHAQKVSVEDMELEEIKNEKDKNTYKINSGAKSEARLKAVYRTHHNARILCVMEHPTLKIRQNASLLLDVQYTPSFAISRTPGFGYPLREGIEVSLKCDVDSNPPSTPRWQKDDGEPPVPQTGDGFLNFTSIRREHSGWYKCTSRHLNFQYSSIGYYLSVRYDSVDVTSEPDDQDMSVAASSHNPNKGQLEVQLGGAVTLQCPQGSLGCWSHLDPVTARLRGLGHGLSTPTGQFSLKDVVYQDAGTYKCIGQSPMNKKKLEVLQTVAVTVKGAPTVVARNSTPVAYPGSPLHLAVEFCANPPAHAARWLHGDRVYTPGNQYGNTVLAYGVTDLPTPYCKEARLTYVSMHERVPRTFYFIVSSPGGVAEAIFKVNFTMRYRTIANAIDDEEEELSEPEEIHFPVFDSSNKSRPLTKYLSLLIYSIIFFLYRTC